MITFKLLLALAPTLGLAVDVITHLFATWGLRLHGLYPRLFFGAAWGGVATTALTIWAAIRIELGPIDFGGYVLFNIFCFGVLSFGYFNFVQMNLSSLRLRIANELHDSVAGVPLEQLLQMYGAHEIVDQRLARLSRGRQIKHENGRYFHRFSAVYAIAVAMDTMKRLVFGRRIRDSFKSRRG